MQQIVLASNNPGKLKELKGLLRPLGIDAIPQSHWSVPEADEPHGTFLENALAKARNAARHTGLPALADDSGLCVPVLGGDPGVNSAFNAKLMEELRDVHDRSAFYYCVLVLVSEPDDPVPTIADGRWSGIIIKEPHGDNGFGYDPYFLSRDHKRTAAQLTEAEKNKASHRGKALAALAVKLRER
jgi:XTP/dITP diphosphohydrolase